LPALTGVLELGQLEREALEVAEVPDGWLAGAMLGVAGAAAGIAVAELLIEPTTADFAAGAGATGVGMTANG
jgi:hypothetical protein